MFMFCVLLCPKKHFLNSNLVGKINKSSISLLLTLWILYFIQLTLVFPRQKLLLIGRRYRYESCQWHCCTRSQMSTQRTMPHALDRRSLLTCDNIQKFPYNLLIITNTKHKKFWKDRLYSKFLQGKGWFKDFGGYILEMFLLTYHVMILRIFWH